MDDSSHFYLTPTDATPAEIQKQYKLKLNRQEIEFLGAFLASIIARWQDRDYILEVTTVYFFARRFNIRLSDPKDDTLKLNVNEAIALKRVFYAAPVYPDFENHGWLRSNIYGKLDQMMIGIH